MLCVQLISNPSLYDWKKLLETAFTHTGSDLLFAIEQAIATGIQYMIYNTLNSNYLYLLDRYLKIKIVHIQTGKFTYTTLAHTNHNAIKDDGVSPIAF